MSERAAVVSVIRHEVKAGSEAAYEAWTKEVLAVAQRFPGHQGVAVIPPAAGSRVYAFVVHFDTIEHLRGWLESDTRRQLLARIQPHLAADIPVEIRPGLEVWMPPQGQAPPRPYKQFLLVWAVIYPLQLIVPPTIARAWDAPLPLRGLLGSAVIVALLTWAIMPRLTRSVSGWLYR